MAESKKTRFSTIGTNVSKIDAIDKVTGKAVYGHDLKVPGMLHGKILRSRYPHALIRRIDTSKAEKLPGVVSVITAKNTACLPIGFMKDHPVLKGDKVRSLRDEIAAVAAVSEEAAEEACRLISVTYEPLPAVFDPFDAMKSDAPQIHAYAPRNRVPHKYEFATGNADKVLDKSEFLVEGTYRTSYVTHCCMEPSFALASFDGNGKLTMWSTTQIPYLMQNLLSRCLAIPGHDIRILQTAIGGAFGSKLDVYPYEVIAALLARASNRPVRILYTREEEFACAPTRQPMVIRMVTGCDKEGLLTARKCEATLDAGAYTSWGVTTPHIMLIGISSLYKVQNIYFRARSIYTNNPYAGAFRGYGNPQGTFANEQQMDELAFKVGIDPVTFRMLNANSPNSITPQKFKVTTCGLRECLEKAASQIVFDKKKDKWEGVGIASMMHVGGGGRVYRSDGCGVIIKLDDFGKAVIITGATEIGTGSDTAMAMIASEELGIPMEKVSVVNNDTETGPWDVGIHASRTTFIAGNAVIKACRKLKARLARFAAPMLACPVEKVEFRGGHARCSGDATKKVAIDRIIRSAHYRENGTVFVESAFYDPPNEFQAKDMTGNISATYSFAAHAARVKVDPGTGRVKVLKFVAVHDAGRVINPSGLDGQIHGAIQQGLGYALTENLQVEKGRTLNPSFLDYKMFTFMDMPKDIEVHYVETNDPAGPYGAKGVSEAGLIPIPAAVANAVADATGARIHSLPISPEKILAAIKIKG